MIELSLFRHFVPMHVLPPGERAELAKHCRLVDCTPGQVPFRRGIVASEAVWLVEGQVELEDADGTRRIQAGTEEARHALSNADAFAATARCVDRCRLLFVNRARLDYVMAWAQSGAIEVREIGEEADSNDWMGMMLQCPAMQMIPPANIARVLSRVDFQQVPAGSVIISQGAPGDAYFVVTSGCCEVLRHDPDGSERVLGELGAGQGFGEEALLSGEPRNATVRAASDCRLVRLGAADFAELLQAPVLRRVDLDKPPARAQFVDVRLPEEFARGHLAGAVNVPLMDLRERCGALDRSRPLVVYCDGGRRSAAATFLLCERGFDAAWLAGGVAPELLDERGSDAG